MLSPYYGRLYELPRFRCNQLFQWKQNNSETKQYCNILILKVYKLGRMIPCMAVITTLVRILQVTLNQEKLFPFKNCRNLPIDKVHLGLIDILNFLKIRIWVFCRNPFPNSRNSYKSHRNFVTPVHPALFHKIASSTKVYKLWIMDHVTIIEKTFTTVTLLGVLFAVATEGHGTNRQLAIDNVLIKFYCIQNNNSYLI